MVEWSPEARNETRNTARLEYRIVAGVGAGGKGASCPPGFGRVFVCVSSTGSTLDGAGPELNVQSQPCVSGWVELRDFLPAPISSGDEVAGELLQSDGMAPANVSAPSVGESRRRCTSYHNWAHAVHVLWLLRKLLAATRSTVETHPDTRFALLLAALGHDVGHPGSKLVDLPGNSNGVRVPTPQHRTSYRPVPLSQAAQRVKSQLALRVFAAEFKEDDRGDLSRQQIFEEADRGDLSGQDAPRHHSAPLPPAATAPSGGEAERKDESSMASYSRRQHQNRLPRPPYDGEITRDLDNPPLENFHWELTDLIGQHCGGRVARYFSHTKSRAVIRHAILETEPFFHPMGGPGGACRSQSGKLKDNIPGTACHGAEHLTPGRTGAEIERKRRFLQLHGLHMVG